jgi:2-hydroxy-3-keto-5-methylthiopentenyl-1-phosphate phosphatase
MPRILVTDYDGTLTRVDFYTLLAERHVPAGTEDHFAAYRAGRLTHFEAMARYFAFTPTDEAGFEALLEASQPDPKAGEAARALVAAGWELLVVSAGCGLYIDRVLGRLGVPATVYANPGRLVPGKGLVLERLPPGHPFFSADVGVDKAAVVRDALGRAEVVAFAGDGPPDVAPALLVPAERRFARSHLAQALQARGEGFHPFEAWHQVAEALL